jgi:site-specific recombinase XerD
MARAATTSDVFNAIAEPQRRARRGRSFNTVRAYRSDLADFARFHPHPLAEATPAVLRSYLATLTGRAPSTRARREAASSSLLAWAYRAELLDADPMSRIDHTRLPPPAPRPVPTGQVTAVLRVIPAIRTATGCCSSSCTRPACASVRPWPSRSTIST